ncbi:GAF domain-containing protein, partial [Actinotalea sp. C106]|uniref:sensor histidine kinase n=1 Tax=Actinotalea sp. C106 TaxID=2908644 RepID=UPI0020285C19
MGRQDRATTATAAQDRATTAATAAAATDLLRAVLALAADLDLPSLLERFVDASTAMTGARYGAINILDDLGASTTFVQSGVTPETVAALAHPPHSTGVLGQIPAEGFLRLEDLTLHPAFGGLPAGHPPMGSFLGTAVRVQDAVYGYLYLSEKEAGFDDEDEAVVGALAAAAAVAIQNAELYAVERRREGWLTAGQRITTMLLEGSDQEEVLSQVACSAREIDGADTVALALPGIDGELVLEIVDGQGYDDLFGVVLPRTGRAWSAFRSGRGQIVPSLARIPGIMPELRGYGPALYAPLRSAGESVGVLMVLRRLGASPFIPSDLALAQSFAGQAALAFVLAEARHAEDAAVLHDERMRIARDLHDLAIQQLFAAGMQLETARHRADDEARLPGLLGVLEGARDSVDSAVRQIRVIVRTLDSPDETTSLVERVRREARGAQACYGVPASLTITLDGRPVDSAQVEQGDVDRIDAALGTSRADDVVAVVREGLANAAR